MASFSAEVFKGHAKNAAKFVGGKAIDGFDWAIGIALNKILGPIDEAVDSYNEVTLTSTPTHDSSSSKPAQIKQSPPFNQNLRYFNAELTDPAKITGIRVLPETVTPNDIMGKNIDEVRDRPQLDGLHVGSTPMRWALIDREEGQTEYLGVALETIDGKAFNQLLFSNATGGLYYGLDTNDIWNDWRDIEKQTGDMQKRKARHESMGAAWEIFTRDRDFFRFLIGRDAGNKKETDRTEPMPRLLPVMRWIYGPTGRKFIYDLPDSGVQQQLIAEFLSDKQELLPHLPNPQCYNPTVGILEIGHLDEGVRTFWRENYGYGTDEKSRGNGSTQAGVQTLRFDSPHPVWPEPKAMLLNGEFVINTEQYLAARAVSR